MEANRASVLVLLLVCGMFLLEYNTAEACPLYCLEADYMICESSGSQRLSPACNCCLAGKGCTIYFNDGTSETC
ncbi:hypothetical protein LOK49_LG05G02089 [Camellia lanceoleosa]|uniref:Uncharacterized protein n=1 Tax=Camellia lanceoleosa TaxID=1840588 RepID=A0ACC0HLK0_9ERIC|nr:hypothetical protein LOK49_LG05G02089 [Camellia lanceoleosa]